MKFIHIADLHLGKQLGDLSLLSDQAYSCCTPLLRHLVYVHKYIILSYAYLQQVCRYKYRQKAY